LHSTHLLEPPQSVNGGLFDWTPKFVRRYGNLRETIAQSVQNYARNVRSGDFPATAELYTLKDG
jgi:3-methyl-2-oxobutanoate hydroxymethyltransferase